LEADLLSAKMFNETNFYQVQKAKLVLFASFGIIPKDNWITFDWSSEPTDNSLGLIHT